jgi:hypothetical protein
MAEFECFCGDTFDTRDQLIQHNVDGHEMSRDESMRAVMDKYPRGV